MKIDNLNPLLRNNQPQQRDETQKAGSLPTAEPKTESRATTQLSQASLGDHQDIDTARVEEIRSAIREGRMEIRADRIADGLIESLRETGGDDLS